MFVEVAGEGLGGAAGDRGVGERIADAAEIDVEILSPRRPVRAEQAEKLQFVLDAAADRKPGLAMGERWVAGSSLRDALLDFPKGAAAGGIDQRRPDRIAQPAAHGAEPGEPLIDRGRAHAAAEVDTGQISAAGAALEISVEAQYPASELPIVPDDAAGVEAARRQEECLGVSRRDRDDERAVVAAYPVTERAADKQTRPF